MWRGGTGKSRARAATAVYFVRLFFSMLSQLLFTEPPRCASCGRRPLERSWLGMCDRCLARIAWVSPPLCQTCGKPLRARRVSVCADCEDGGRLFSRVRSVTLYDGALREYLHRLKFRGERALAVPLGRVLSKVELEPPLWSSFRQCDAIVPIPIDPARAEVRGFNQAELLAEEVAIAWSRPLWTDILLRRRGEHAQVGLSRRARAANMRGALYVTRPEAARGRIVLVIDDVLTTGATLDEAARALLRAGAREVNGLCLSVGVTASDWDAKQDSFNREH